MRSGGKRDFRQVRNKETLEWLQEMFGKIKQLKRGINVERHRYSVSTSEQMDFVIPAAKMTGLSTGMFVGSLGADINNKGNILLHARIKSKQYPSIEYFSNNGQFADLMKNYKQVEESIQLIVN